MKQPNMTVYGSKSCSDTTRMRSFLDSHEIAYEYKDVDENPEFNDYIAGLNGGKRVLPTIRFDNESYFNPKPSEIEAAIASSANVQ